MKHEYGPSEIVHSRANSGNWDKAPERHAEDCRKGYHQSPLRPGDKVTTIIANPETLKAVGLEEIKIAYGAGCGKKTNTEYVDLDEHYKQAKERDKELDRMDNTLYDNSMELAAQGKVSGCIDGRTLMSKAKENTYDDKDLSDILKEADHTLELPSEGYKYSFIDAFRFLMKGHTITFVNDRRKFKMIDDKIIELVEFQGFSSKSMLKDKFYVGNE